MVDLQAWWIWAQSNPYVASTQIVGNLTIGIAVLTQLGLTKIADVLQKIENAILDGQAAAKTAFVASMKAPT